MSYITGGMNTDVDLGFLQGGQDEAREVNEKDPSDRSRTIRYFCENTIESIEDDIYDVFLGKHGSEALDNPTKKLCQELAGWCTDDMSSELYPDSDPFYHVVPTEKLETKVEL